MAFGVTNFSLKFSEKHDKIRSKKQGISINSISVTYEDLYLRNIPVTENPCFKTKYVQAGRKRTAFIAHTRGSVYDLG